MRNMGSEVFSSSSSHPIQHVFLTTDLTYCSPLPKRQHSVSRIRSTIVRPRSLPACPLFDSLHHQTDVHFHLHMDYHIMILLSNSFFTFSISPLTYSDVHSDYNCLRSMRMKTSCDCSVKHVFYCLFMVDPDIQR